MYEVPRCAGPDCNRPLTRLGTGRRPKYCGPNCRKAAQRERDRQAEAGQRRAVQLAEAKATMARLRRPLEEAAFHAVPDWSADAYASACDPGLPPADLDRSLAQLRLAVDELAVLAGDYRQAAREAARLTDPSPRQAETAPGLG